MKRHHSRYGQGAHQGLGFEWVLINIIVTGVRARGSLGFPRLQVTGLMRCAKFFFYHESVQDWS